MSRRVDRIHTLLTEHFAPALLEVRDDSALHAGHAGARPLPGQPAGETHFAVTIVSHAFHGRSRVQRSRAVHEVLAGELATGLHALALVLRTPQEQDGGMTSA